MRVTARLQTHPGGSLGYRLGDALAFLTDCSPSEDAGSFAHGVNVLIHEAWMAAPEAVSGVVVAPHSSAREAGEAALKGDVGELLLCHLHPMLSEGELQEVLAAARAVFSRSHLAEDGMRRSVKCSNAPSSSP